jgi:hypothetical protein
MIFIVFVAAAMAALTWLVGWWGVLLAALIIGFVFRDEGGGGWRIAIAAAFAWGGLLLVDASGGPLGPLVQRLAAIMRLPAVVLMIATLLFPALLAWSAATVAAIALQRRRPNQAQSGH